LLVSDERDNKISRIITAREGRLLTDEENRRITLRLINGAVSEADVLPAAPAVPTTNLKEMRPPLSGAASADRYRLTNFSIYDMSLSVDSPLKSSSKAEKPEKDLTLAGLEEKIVELKNDRYAQAPYKVEWHKRFAFPLAALVFALVAFPLAVRSHRGGRAIALIGSLTILTAYYLLLTTLEGAALRVRIPAWVAIWTPNALFGTAGLALMVMVARDVRWRT